MLLNAVEKKENVIKKAQILSHTLHISYETGETGEPVFL